MKLVIAAIAVVLLAGCSSSPAAVTSSTGPPATTTLVAAPTPVKPPTFPPPLVGHCDIQVSSVGAVTGSIRNGNCALSTAISAPLNGTHSLLMEVTWDTLQPSIIALQSSIEFPTCPAGTAIPPMPCPPLATNSSMEKPVRVAVEGDAYTTVAKDIAGFVNVYQGAATQQPFTVTFSAFAQDHVPANFTAIPST